MARLRCSRIVFFIIPHFPPPVNRFILFSPVSNLHKNRLSKPSKSTLTNKATYYIMNTVDSVYFRNLRSFDRKDGK